MGQGAAPKNKAASFIPQQNAPMLAGKNGRKRRSKAAPAQPAVERPKSEAQIRHEHKVDKANQIKHMKEHFQETDRLMEKNDSWPMHYIHSQISFHINQCKDKIKETRTHTGPGAHKLNAEAVHAKHIDAEGWTYKAWFSDIQGYAESTGIKNHLTLPRPLAAPGSSKLYVNVVLSWLFAAKRQLMANLAEYIKDAPTKTADMAKFLDHNTKGVNARKAYRTDKDFLGVKHHAHPYTLADEALLQQQRDAFHGS